VSAKHTFNLQSKDKQRPLPRRLILGQQDSEPSNHVLLKVLSYILFFRPRLQLEMELDRDALPFVPDLVELDYGLRPKLWIECGECSLGKLHKLAVKLPDCEIWIVKGSAAAAHELRAAMEKDEFRRDRYGIIGLDETMFEEACALIRGRNELFWVDGGFEPPGMQFDFNGLWFDAPFIVLRH
jgi:uncharacterized protein YaeQ